MAAVLTVDQMTAALRPDELPLWQAEAARVPYTGRRLTRHFLAWLSRQRNQTNAPRTILVGVGTTID